MQVVAHRGNRAAHPENTAAAFGSAMECGADGIEFDVMLTSDCVPVISHDDDLSRTCLVDVRVSESPLSELLKLNAAEYLGDGRVQRIMTLEETVELLAGKIKMFVELKAVMSPSGWIGSDSVAEVALGMIEPTPGVVVSSFDSSGPELARQRGFQVALSIAETADFTTSIQWAAEHHYTQVHPGLGHATKANVAAAHELGLEVVAWTANGEVAVRSAVEAGLDGVFTDEPGWTREFLSGG